MMWQNKLKSRWWRLTHLYKIKNKQGEIITFKPNRLQLKHLQERGNHRYNRVLKFRQGGFTTLYAIDLLDRSLWEPGNSSGIIAHEAKKLSEYFSIIKRAFVNLPENIKPITKTDTKHMYEFVTKFNGAPLDSSIYVSTKLRGGTVQNLHITEIAYIKDYQELKAGSKQAVPTTGRISEETTANGFNEYYDDYMDSLNDPSPGPMDYRSYFYSWVENPEYTLQGEITDGYTKEEESVKRIGKEQFGVDVSDGQLLWRRWKMKELKRQTEGLGLTGDQLFKQEYPLTLSEAFQSGAGNVFDTEKIDTIKPVEPLTLDEGLLQPNLLVPEFQSLHNKGVWFWETPQPGEKYIIGVDPSDGEGSDFGDIDVWRERDNAQVAQYYGKLRPDELAELTREIAVFYNNAFVGVENNMLSTILFLSKIYDNYYFETRIDEKTDKRTKKLGWNTNTKTRDVMIDDFIIHFDEDNLVIRSKVTLSQMKTFVRKDNGKREHADGKFDDALFGGLIALQMKKHNQPRVRVFSNKPF